MSSQADLPQPETPAAQNPIEQWPQYRHPRRKRRRFSRRKTKKTVRIVVIVVLHIIVIAFLLYIWTKLAYSSAKTDPLQNHTIASGAFPDTASGITSAAALPLPASVKAS
jgi:hypothetical protein